MKIRSNIWLFALMVFIVPFSAFAFFNWYEKKLQRLTVYGGDRHQVGAFRLLDEDSSVVTDAVWNDKIVVADFFFTHCPTICPAMQKNMQKVRQYFANDAGIILTSFTVDPENDGPSQLKQYSRSRNIVNGDWKFLTGDKKEIYKLARNGFMIVATDGDGGPSDFIHSEKLVLLDRKGRIRGYYDGTSDKATEQLLTDIKKLKDEK
jgi:protein SCO1